MMLRPFQSLAGALGWLMTVMLALPTAIALAQGPVYSSTVMSSWTSNAEGRADGQSDVITETTHTLGLVHEQQDFVLRGAISFSETRYTRLWQEDDSQIGIDLAGDWHLAANTALRANMALGWHSEGQAIPFDPGPVAARTAIFKGRFDLEIETRSGDTDLAIAFGYETHRHGATGFGTLIPPARTRADTQTLSADLRLSRPISENIALLALMRGLAQTITQADQIDFARIPVRVLRLAGGVAIEIPKRAAFLLELGGDAIGSGVPGLPITMAPYVRSQVTLALGDRLEVFSRLRTSLDFATPGDGYVDWTLEGRMGIGYAMAQSARLEAAILASATRSIGFDIELGRSLGGELSAEIALGDNVAGRASLSHVRHEERLEVFDETRLGLALEVAL